MFAFELNCPVTVAEDITAELWNWEPLAVGEQLNSDGSVSLTAGFLDDMKRDRLLQAFAEWQPEWRQDETDWVAKTKAAWPPRRIGKRIVVMPPWSREAIDDGMIRVVLNPGMASGTGEHPCTQLVVQALESVVSQESRVADIGTGSGILAIVAAQLGAAKVLAIEPDCEATENAQENIGLNKPKPLLAAGFADAVASGWATIAVANINGSVLFSIFDELVRVMAPGGCLIVSGFEEEEVLRFQSLLPRATVTIRDGWACLTTYFD